jgi:hypothetical protein
MCCKETVRYQGVHDSAGAGAFGHLLPWLAVWSCLIKANHGRRGGTRWHVHFRIEGEALRVYQSFLDENDESLTSFLV